MMLISGRLVSRRSHGLPVDLGAIAAPPAVASTSPGVGRCTSDLA